ncbi:MAG: hypothetical protein R2794_07360 [Chitinophagales bacterium]
MKKTLYVLALCCLFGFGNTLRAQLPAMGNIIKYNITPTAFGIYTLQYEMVLNPKQSIAIGLGIAPNIDLPFKETLLNIYGDNAEAVAAINSTSFTAFNITPEYRFYVGGKTAPEGFYLASYLRYTHMTHEQVYQFTSSSGKVHTPLINTTFNGVGAGEMMGVQWLLGAKDNIVLDWWILGPWIGVMSGHSHGTDDMSDMDAEDRAKLESDIENTPIPLWTIDATVGNDVVDVDLGGGFYGLRAMGLCIGIKF